MLQLSDMKFNDSMVFVFYDRIHPHQQIFNIRVIFLHAIRIALSVPPVVSHIVEDPIKRIFIHHAVQIVEQVLIPFGRGGIAAPVAVIILNQHQLWIGDKLLGKIRIPFIKEAAR